MIGRIARLTAALCALTVVVVDAADYALRNESVITRTLRFAGQGERTLDIRNLHGSIRVAGYERDAVQLEARRTIAANSERDLRRGEAEAVLDFVEDAPTIEAVVREPNGPVCGEDWDGGWRRRPSYHVTYDFTVSVPARTRLRLCTINGREIIVSGTSGDFDIENVNGRITLNNLRGSGSATTVNGPVTASFLDIPRGNSLFKTVNGNVTVTWPDGLAADLKMQTFNGGLFTDFTVEPVEVRPAPAAERRDGRFVYRSNRSTQVRVGRGGPEVTLESFNGNVRVLRAHDR
jgi:hypothetical protein